MNKFFYIFSKTLYQYLDSELSIKCKQTNRCSSSGGIIAIDSQNRRNCVLVSMSHNKVAAWVRAVIKVGSGILEFFLYTFMSSFA